MLSSQVSTSSCPATLLLIQILAHGLGKTANGGPSVWASAAGTGNPENATSSWFMPGPIHLLQPYGDWINGWKISPTFSLSYLQLSLLSISVSFQLSQTNLFFLKIFQKDWLRSLFGIHSLFYLQVIFFTEKALNIHKRFLTFKWPSGIYTLISHILSLSKRFDIVYASLQDQSWVGFPKHAQYRHVITLWWGMWCLVSQTGINRSY